MIGLVATATGIIMATSTLGTASPIPPPYEEFIAKPVTYETRCSCILYLRKAFDVPIYGNASAQVPNVKKADAVPGDVALLSYSNGVSHVALITEVGSTTFHVKDSNFKRCKETERVIAKASVKGIYRPA